LEIWQLGYREATIGWYRGSKIQAQVPRRIRELRPLLFIIFLLCSLQMPQAQTIPAAPASNVEVYLARDDGGKAGEPAFEFKATDIPIYCVVLLENKRKAAVKMVFVAMDVPGVRPEMKIVTSAYTTTEDQNRVNFTGRPDGNWIPGKYRVDIYVDDKLVTDAAFVIRGNPNTIGPKIVKSTASKRSKQRDRPSSP
jgi:hypothetical protein